MSGSKPRRLPWLAACCLLAVILLGSYMALNDFLQDSSATLAPDLMLGR